MARTGTSVYPATLDAFDRIGTANYEDESGYDHVNVHNEVMDGIEHLEAVVGTTAGTNVLKDFAAGKFAVYSTGGTLNNGVIGTSAITGGTISSGVLANNTIGTPSITSGTATSFTLDTPTVYGTWLGWIQDNATWTSLGGTAITTGVATTGKYAVGDRIKFTQGGTTMYQVLTSVSGTIFVPTGGADYVLGTTAITAPYYSHELSPLGYPQYFAYTPTWGGFATAPSGYSLFSVNGRMCNYISYTGVAGESNADTLTISLPVTASSRPRVIKVLGIGANAGGLLDYPSVGAIAQSGTIIGWSRSNGTVAYGTSGAKSVEFSIIYDI